jgi:hypothetical protein
VLFDVAFPFTARYLLRRHRNPTWMSHVGRITLDIPEIAEADFPAGFAVRTVNLARPAADVRVSRFDIRIHDDACWWPLREPDGGQPVAIWRFRDKAAEGGFLFDAATKFGGRRLVGTRGCFPKDPLPEAAIKELLESDEEAVKVRLQRRAAEDLKVFDGRLYVRGNEPVLLLEIAEPSRGKRQISVVLADDIDAAALDRDDSLIPKTFRIDEAEMVSSLAERFMTAQKTRKTPIETCKVEILPSSYRLRFDPVTPALLRAARRIREEATKIRIIEATGVSRDEVMAATDPAEPWRLAETLKPVVARLKEVEDAAGRRSPAVVSALAAISRSERSARDGVLAGPDEEALANMAF